ncbi:YraN family protein [uncultured Devosia sp.]|uniref:YraN family protein n=1 Tax=uncultured Devosia sp. TaxID=211434 RepID=UPI0035CAC60E
MPPSPSKPKSSKRIAAQLGGHRSEALAAWFLRLQLYRIIATRYKTPVGEIDLIAERFGTTVFVEVKARGHVIGEAEALEAVNTARISRAAHYWLAKHPTQAETPFRFDVIFLAPRCWPRHVVNAFDAS